jgi:hypothetical protein
VTDFAGEDMLVGLVASGLVFWILLTVQRGLRDERLPIGRGHVSLEERPGAFRALILLYGAAALLVAFIALDLLFNLRERLSL